MHCVCATDIELLETSLDHKTKFRNHLDRLCQKMDNNRRLVRPSSSVKFQFIDKQNSTNNYIIPHD